MVSKASHFNSLCWRIILDFAGEATVLEGRFPILAIFGVDFRLFQSLLLFGRLIMVGAQKCRGVLFNAPERCGIALGVQILKPRFTRILQGSSAKH